MRRAIGLVLLAGGVGSVCLLAYGTDLGRPTAWLWGAGIALWSLAPYAVAARATRLVAGSLAAERILLVAAGLLSTFGLAVLAQAFVLAPDARSGLVPLLLPVWQLLGLAPFAIAAQRRARRPDATPPASR